MFTFRVFGWVDSDARTRYFLWRPVGESAIRSAPVFAESVVVDAPLVPSGRL